MRQTVAMSSLAGGGAGFVLADRPELNDAGRAYFQGSCEDDGWHESASIAAFLGAANGQVLSDHTDHSTAGKDLMDGVSRLDMDLVQSSLDQINQSCEHE